MTNRLAQPLTALTLLIALSAPGALAQTGAKPSTPPAPPAQTGAKPASPPAQAAQEAPKTPPAPIAGEWVVADQTARIRIAPCGEAHCGIIVWTKTQGGVDENNPDPAKRTQPVLGLEIIKNMKPAGANRWEGNVYNAKNGKTYSASLTAESPTAMKIEGCLFTGFLCGGETWTRAPDTTGTVPAAGSAARARPAPAPTR